MDKPIPEAVAKAAIYARNEWLEKHPGDAVGGMQAALTAAQQQGQAVAWVPVHPKQGPLWAMATDKPDRERLPSYPLRPLAYAYADTAQPMQQGGGEVLARGWLHRRGPGDDYDLHDEASGAGKDCKGCVPCVIVRAGTAPPSAPVGATRYRPEVRVGEFGGHYVDMQPDPDGGYVRLEDLAQQPAAVDEAMVERAALAYEAEVDGDTHSPNVPREAMRAALNAAIATQHQEPTT